jgi:hypothetical protein
VANIDWWESVYLVAFWVRVYHINGIAWSADTR